MDKINQLLKINKNFLGLTVIPCSIFVVMFFVILLFSVNHPILLLLTVILVVPGTWLLVHILFKYRTKLQNDIKIRLTKLIRQELQKEFEANNFSCHFDVKLRVFFDDYCSFDVVYCNISSATLYHKYAKKVRDNINDKFPCWHQIRFISAEVNDTLPDIVV